jgi:hypothetical protein
LVASCQTCSGPAALSVETVTFGMTHLLGTRLGGTPIRL